MYESINYFLSVVIPILIYHNNKKIKTIVNLYYYLSLREDAINLHRILRGKIEINNRISLDSDSYGNRDTLSLIYTPGVAFVADAIYKSKELAYEYTSKWNNVAIICDGTRVLGLGDIGPEGALPVMEGKSVLFKVLGGINAIPLCIGTTDKEEIVKFAKAIQPSFGAINIEDIESPKVLEIVDRLSTELDIPVFHDDQHGTAVISFAALINALRIVNKKLSDIKVVISGAGSAGYGIFRILRSVGYRNSIIIDSKGSIYNGREDTIGTNENYNKYKEDMAKNSNHEMIKGTLQDVVKGTDVFIGVSGKANLLTKDMVKSMSNDPIIFALSNPNPEILPSVAVEAGAKVVATGRSDFPNQINNAAVFPSLIRSLLDLRIRSIDEHLLANLSFSIADLIQEEHLRHDYIIPKINDPRLLHIVKEILKKTIQQHGGNLEKN